MQKDSKLRIRELRVDGGATVNDNLMQFQADILYSKVVRPEITETTALGAAYLAGLAVKYWGSVGEIKKQWAVERAFSPSIKEKSTKTLISGWHRAVKAAQVWADEGT